MQGKGSVFTVKEIFYTLQGEGSNAGRPAVFCRFTGCNLWSGLERDRSKAICQFCDTDFVGGTKFDLSSLVSEIARHWPGSGNPFVVFTGGEPMLQLTSELIEAVKAAGFSVAVETNGTIERVRGQYWTTVSPKAGTSLKITAGDELKLVYPQAGLDPQTFLSLPFKNFYLQAKGVENESVAAEYVLNHPQWRLSLQTHKHLGIR